MNTKAMSPLIATVVLIAFAVALGAVIMTWSARLVDSSQENVTYKCVDLSVGIYKYQTGDYDVCYTDDSIIFTVESHRGKISGLQMFAITTGEEIFKLANVLEKPLDSHEPRKVVVPYDFEKYGEIKELKFFPLLGKEPNMHVCDNAPFTVGPVSRCQ